MDKPSVPLVPIGQFSLLTRLTVRALRLYDQEGLLPPTWTDPQTGYRYYHASQAALAEQIRVLRSADLPLDDVRTAVSDPAALPGLLTAHSTRLRERVEQSERALNVLRLLQKGVTVMQSIDVPIEVRDVAPARGACLETTTDQGAIGQVLGILLPQIGGFLRAAGLRGGHDFAVYPDDDYDPQHMTVVAGISCASEVPGNDLGVQTREYGGGRSVVGTLRGPYEAEGESRVSQAWMEVWAWIAEQGYQRRGPGYELYVLGFAEGDDPTEFVTEIVVPIG